MLIAGIYSGIETLNNTMGDTLDGADQMLEELKAEVLKHFE